MRTAVKWGDCTILGADRSTDKPQDIPLAEHLACPEHGTTISEIVPRTFSFNTPHGACPECQGLGIKLEIDPDRVIPDHSLSLKEGAIIALDWSTQSNEPQGYRWQMVEAVSQQYDIDLEEPFENLTQEKIYIILYGTIGEEVKVHYSSRDGRSAT